MTDKEQLIRARLAILALAAEIKNVGKACKLAGISRSQFYTMKKAYETNGKEGLAPRIRRKPDMPNRTPSELEERILFQTYGNPTISYIRLAEALKSNGMNVTPTMIRYVWQRHALSTRVARVLWAKAIKSSVSDASTGDGQIEIQQTPFSAAIPVIATSSRKSITGEKSFEDKGPGVDWTYWTQRVREYLNK